MVARTFHTSETPKPARNEHRKSMSASALQPTREENVLGGSGCHSAPAASIAPSTHDMLWRSGRPLAEVPVNCIPVQSGTLPPERRGRSGPSTSSTCRRLQKGKAPADSSPTMEVPPMPMRDPQTFTPPETRSSSRSGRPSKSTTRVCLFQTQLLNSSTSSVGAVPADKG
jgi:hypothetical protein